MENDVDEGPCASHPKTLSAVACGKCGAFICPRCMIFTPVGVRCRGCANLRPPVQFDVGADRVFLAGSSGLVTSIIGWYIALQAYFVVWLFAVFVGIGVGEVASRVTKRRDNVALEIVVGADIVIGFLVISAALSTPGMYLFRPGIGSLVAVNLGSISFSIIPLVLAVVFGVTRLRR